jgi:kinetochore protein Nuf2
MKNIYPQLSIQDIIDSLAGWGISVSPEQLRNPTTEFVEGVYCACLQQVTGLNYEILRDPVQNTLESGEIEDRVSEMLAFGWKTKCLTIV